MMRFPGCTLAALLAVIALDGVALGADAKETMRSFTGSHTRVVWVQDLGDGTDSQAEHSKLVLMGLDSDTGDGERPILPTPSNYYRPLITPDGTQVVFSNIFERKVYLVNWDGSGLKEIARGVADALWRDPETELIWVYVRSGPKKRSKIPGGGTVDRVQILQSQIAEPVWRLKKKPLEDFQLSGDGTRAVGSFPWPNAGLADLARGTVSSLGKGCWPSLSPDNSYRCWVFEGSHRAVRMYQPGVKEPWTVPINVHPDLAKHEVYHPRWSNDPRFICLTGPYWEIEKGGARVEVYLGKFSANYREIERIVQVTHNQRADFYPDVWIDPAPQPSRKDLAGPAPAPRNVPFTPAPEKPPPPEHCVVNARLLFATPAPDPKSLAPYRRALLANDYEVTEILSGKLAVKKIQVAHWGIIDTKVVPQQWEAGATYRLTLEPYSLQPQLEGERLVSASEDFGLPLYYAADAKKIESAPPRKP